MAISYASMSLDYIVSLYHAAPTVDFCEQPLGSVIKRPGYALSNVWYIIVGIRLLLDRRSRASRMLGMLSLLIGSVSFLYDMTYSYLFQILDLTMIFVLASYLLMLNLRRAGYAKGMPGIVMSSSVVAVCVASTYMIKGHAGIMVILALFITILATEWMCFLQSKARASYTPWIIGTAAAVFGTLIWLLDFYKIWCDPQNLFNGRGWFHFFTSITIYCYAMFYTQFEEGNKVGHALGFRELKDNFRRYMAFLKGLSSDRRVPWISKALIGMSIAYFLMPIDIIPDFIPVLGQIDDLIIVPGLALLGLAFIPRDVYKENYDRAFGSERAGRRTPK